MDVYADTLLTLLRAALNATAPDQPFTNPLPAEQWEAVYRLAAEHGVLALAYDGILRLPSSLRPPRPLLLRWACNTQAIERRYAFQKERAAELAELFAAEGIDTYVLKGMAVGSCYPRADHRPAGDLDCFLPGACDRGNRIAREAGAEVREGYYKHAHIRYRGLLVENHRYCLSIRGSHRMKELEQLLEELMPRTEARAYVPGTKLLIPSSLFTAVLLTRHALGHFLTEGIRLRHLCDWACLLRAEQEQIDAAAFRAISDRFRLTAFADAMTVLAVQRLGLQLTVWPCPTSTHADRLMEDMLDCSRTVFARKGSPWIRRMRLARNMLGGGWRYRAFCDHSMTAESLRVVWGYLADRNPAL